MCLFLRYGIIAGGDEMKFCNQSMTLLGSVSQVDKENKNLI